MYVEKIFLEKVMIPRRILRRLLPARVEGYVNHSLSRAHTQNAIAAILRSGAIINLEIGSGPVKGRNGWVSMDLSTESDLPWDLLEPLPLPDGSVTAIYSSHLLEHFYYRDLMLLLRECLRILRPGGTFSASVPDASIFIRAYSTPDLLDRDHLAYKPAVYSDQRMDIVNYIAYMDSHHRYMFDQDNLVHILSNAGLANVCARGFDPELDVPERRHESIYAVGTKPLESAVSPSMAPQKT